MHNPASLNATIIEMLYCDALELADEARGAFDMAARIDSMCEDEDLARVALSCEALRTTTRMMHAIAWLLNQRAHLAGDLSEFQLRRHGRLPPPQPEGDAGQLSVLNPQVRELVGRTQSFYARIERLDRAFREQYAMHPPAIDRLRSRLSGAAGAL